MERQEGTTLKLIHPGHVERYKFAAARIKGRVLDAACGVGYGSRMMHDTGARVVGVDIEESAIRTAEKHYSGPGYILGNIYDSPWAGHFDWIVSLETIEHLKEPLRALCHFRRDGEGLIVSTPNERHYAFDPKQYEGSKYPHVRHYAPQELGSLLRTAGWEVIQRYCQVGKTDPVTEGVEGKFLVYVCK